MIRNKFGKSGFDVTLVGFGAGHIGRPEQTDDEVAAILNGVLDLGINLIDTARGYGESEERIGRMLSARRDEYILSSKCGYGIAGVDDWTWDAVARGIDQSLQRLNTDRIDIMHLHSCTVDVLRNGFVIDALDEARRAGKVRAIAFSGENEALEFAIECGRFDSIQTSVNICDQRGIHRFLPRCQDAGLGVIAKRPIANAFWRFEEQPTSDYREDYWQRARAMQLSPPAGTPWTEYAARFAAHAPGVHSIIVGSSKLDHVREIIEAVGKGPFREDIILDIEGRFAANDRGWAGQT